MAWRMPTSFQCLAPHHGVFLFQKDSVRRSPTIQKNKKKLDLLFFLSRTEPQRRTGRKGHATLRQTPYQIISGSMFNEDEFFCSRLKITYVRIVTNYLTAQVSARTLISRAQHGLPSRAGRINGGCSLGVSLLGLSVRTRLGSSPQPVFPGAVYETIMSS